MRFLLPGEHHRAILQSYSTFAVVVLRQAFWPFTMAV
jgi:hypothetical protein